jgi:hypothetical protein
MDNLNFSEKTALERTLLIKQTKRINIIFQLKGGKLSAYPPYFLISSIIDDDDFT